MPDDKVPAPKQTPKATNESVLADFNTPRAPKARSPLFDFSSKDKEPTQPTQGKKKGGAIKAKKPAVKKAAKGK